MKNTINNLLALVALSPFVASATSPIPPPLTQKFVANCTIDLGVVTENAQGVQQKYDHIRGTLQLTNKDLQDDQDLARKIKWTKWDMRAQRSVPATLKDLPGNAKFTKADFYAMGSSDGKIGSFQLELVNEYVSADKASRIGIKNEVVADITNGKGYARGNAEASQRFSNVGYVYSIDTSCGIN